MVRHRRCRVCYLAVAGIGMALALLASWPGSASAEDMCAIVEQFGLERFGQANKLVEACDRQRLGDSKSGAGEAAERAAPGGAEADPEPDDDEALPRSIYVEDDRIEVDAIDSLSHEKKDDIARAAAATPALVPRPWLQASGGGFTLALQPALPLCKGEAFAGQPTAANCTAFLIAPDLIATAGHCVDFKQINDADPSKSTNAVVFGFGMNGSAARRTFRSDEVYFMRRLIERMADQWGRYGMAARDFAVVQLDRPVNARIARPLRLGTQIGRSIKKGDRLGVIGYPSGMPQKLSFGRNGYSKAMETGSPTVFRAQLNTFHANSGSPVLYYDSPDVVAGILIAGENDYVRDIQNNCTRTVVYASTQLCDGKPCSEKVTKVELIQPYVEE